MITLKVNNKTYTVDVDPDAPLLWVLRENLGLIGTKFGCGAGLCGACSIHLDGKVMRSCITPVSSAEGSEITTIEGISSDRSHPVQQAWIAEQVPQCGYCQSGQIMAAIALLAKNSQPTDADIDEAMTNICRCGMYLRIRKAIHSVSQAMRK
ncbi:MAG: (2Fe-2S)-binding protein [Nitrospira sp.]|nr:(2Fe-2S)-binding protein [Nitrospira sp.]